MVKQKSRKKLPPYVPAGEVQHKARDMRALLVTRKDLWPLAPEGGYLLYDLLGRARDGDLCVLEVDGELDVRRLHVVDGHAIYEYPMPVGFCSPPAPLKYLRGAKRPHAYPIVGTIHKARRRAKCSR